MVIDTGGKTGRRPGTVSSRQAILDAARDQFTQHGFKGATVRAIASQAGADPTLIRHFFGDKNGLFAAAMELPTDTPRRILGAFAAPVDQWGETLTRAYLSMWEDADTAAPLRAILVSAFTNDQALDQLRSFIIRTVLEPASRHLPPDDPTLRLTVAMSHLIGIALTRYILKAPAIREQSLDAVVAFVAPAIQRYLTGPLPSSLSNRESNR